MYARCVPRFPNPEPRNFLSFSEITHFGHFGQVLDNVQNVQIKVTRHSLAVKHRMFLSCGTQKSLQPVNEN
jgi:hypothetical protein